MAVDHSKEAGRSARAGGFGSSVRAGSGRPGLTAAADDPLAPAPVTILLLLAVFVAVLTAYYAIVEAPASIHNDTAEAWAWGREFQLGYYKHPPFWAWIAGTWFLLLPRAGWSFGLLSAVNAGMGLVGSWMLIGHFAAGDRRRAASLLLLLTPFYTFLALKFNANTIFLSLWPWALHFLLRSVEGRRTADAVAFGGLVAAAVLSKYFAAILVVTCVAAALVHPQRRAYFASAAPYVSIAAAMLLGAPHLWWLVHTDFLPFHYFAGEAGHTVAAAGRYAVLLPAAVVGFHGLVIAVVILVRTRAAKPRTPRPALWGDPRFRVLAVLALLPLGLTVLAGLVFRLKLSSNMTVGIFSLVPLLVIELAGNGDDRRLCRVAGGIVGALALGALALSPVIAWARIRLDRDIAVAQPRQEVAGEATRLWREATGVPLAYVAGDYVYADAVGFYSADAPHVFIDLDYDHAPWVTPQAIARHGLLVVCVASDRGCADAAQPFETPQTQRKEVALAHAFLGVVRRPVRFVLIIVPPRS